MQFDAVPTIDRRGLLGVVTRARRAVLHLQDAPSAQALGAARRALARLFQAAMDTNEWNAAKNAADWLNHFYPLPDDTAAHRTGGQTTVAFAANTDLSPVVGWINHGFPLQSVPRKLPTRTWRKAVHVCNETGQQFVSDADARRVLGISRGAMAKYRKGEAATADGYTFRQESIAQKSHGMTSATGAN